MLSWAGTRGVITLAAAFSIPLTTDTGQPLAGRTLILFCTYLAVLVTLVGQGGRFAALLRLLAYGDTTSAAVLLRNQARAAAVRAVLARLDQLATHDPPTADAAGSLRRAETARLERYEARVERLSAAEEGLPPDTGYLLAVRLRREMIAAERDELLRWRDAGRLSDTSLRLLPRELDHQEGLLPPG